MGCSGGGFVGGEEVGGFGEDVETGFGVGVGVGVGHGGGKLVVVMVGLAGWWSEALVLGLVVVG